MVHPRSDYSRLHDFLLLDDYNPEPTAPNYALGYFLADSHARVDDSCKDEVAPEPWVVNPPQ